MVTSSVAEDLTAAGFSCGDGIAYTIENDDYAAAGLYYYDSGLQLFESSELQSVGFVQIVSDTVKYEEPSSAQSVITVVPSDDSIVKHLICTYSYENIVSDHFVYQGYYVSYYHRRPLSFSYLQSFFHKLVPAFSLVLTLGTDRKIISDFVFYHFSCIGLFIRDPLPDPVIRHTEHILRRLPRRSG